jgi:hypothetical protein
MRWMFSFVQQQYTMQAIFEQTIAAAKETVALSPSSQKPLQNYDVS